MRVCVEEGKGEGDVGRRIRTFLVNFTSLKVT